MVLKKYQKQLGSENSTVYKNKLQKIAQYLISGWYDFFVDQSFVKEILNRHESASSVDPPKFLMGLSPAKLQNGLLTYTAINISTRYTNKAQRSQHA